MTYSLDWKPRDGYVILEVVGDFDGSFRSESRKLLNERWQDKGQPLRILADVRQLRGGMSLGEAFFNITEDWIKVPEVRVAILYENPARKEFYQSFEMMARNRGLTAKATTDHDDAVRWLMGEDR